MIEQKTNSAAFAQELEKRFKAQGFKVSVHWQQSTGIFTIKGVRDV